MMDVLLAHSAKNDCPAQTYEAHVQGVFKRAGQYAEEVEHYAAHASENLVELVQRSALLHDLGKLDDENQKVLHDADGVQRHLPINHVDAGSAVLLEQGGLYEALMVYSHHRGLPDLVHEGNRMGHVFRDEHEKVRRHTDLTVKTLLQRHRALCLLPESRNAQEYPGDINVFLRMALSCLADADHTDTAVARQQISERDEYVPLYAEKRLSQLDAYVASLENHDKRSNLRREMYQACRDAEIEENFSTCDSPVGSGKTTAVMAHLLQQAVKRKARHIIVVLPYTSIIQQSVDVYRRALTLPGEDPEKVVAELHSRADFQGQETRYLTARWRAPIIVTTAVNFFETLASNRPAALRKLHELPGSMVFVDEAHNALPLKLLPLAWHWMNVLAEEWGCYWVLASGSLVRYWELARLSEIKMERPAIPELVPASLRERLMAYEHGRISFCWRKSPVGLHELIEWVQQSRGPRLLILNTVQNAAVIASEMAKQYGRSCVEHLSTALTPEDRGRAIDEIKQRLADPDDTDWTLVATSCVEAGVDFSFCTGFRETASLLSLLQAAGRVNRHGRCRDAQMWSFSLQDDALLTRNKGVMVSAEVLNYYFEKGVPIVPELSTRSMNDEIVRDDGCIRAIKSLIEHEKEGQFPTVDQEFEVIDSDTVPVVVDAKLAGVIAAGQGDWHLLQKKMVSIRRGMIRKWNLQEIGGGIYQWSLGYDNFLGYMEGVLHGGCALFC